MYQKAIEHINLDKDVKCQKAIMKNSLLRQT